MEKHMEPGRFPNCLMNPSIGCWWPGGCGSCGFDAREAERRRALPLEQGENGLFRKVINRKETRT